MNGLVLINDVTSICQSQVVVMVAPVNQLVAMVTHLYPAGVDCTQVFNEFGRKQFSTVFSWPYKAAFNVFLWTIVFVYFWLHLQ